jgi:hypothetical protein
MFDRILPDTAGSLWTHAKSVPDALVITTSSLDVDLADAARADVYEAFVVKARSVYPNAHVFVIVSAYATDFFPVGKQTKTKLTATAQAVAARRQAAGDSKVYAYGMTTYSMDQQLSACDYHPGPALHAQMAAELEGWIRLRLGW